MQSRTFGLVLAFVALVAVSFGFTPAVRAVYVIGTWTTCPAQGNGPITQENTANPIVGDGTANSAEGEMFDSPLQSAITLDEAGERIQLTGHVRLTGTVGTAGGPRTQFRYGLFNDNANTDRTGWVGYYMSNASGSGTPNGTLARKPVGNPSVYLSVTGQNNLSSTPGQGTLVNFTDDLYSFDLTVEYLADQTLFVSGNLHGATNTFTQSLAAIDATASTLGTYTFDRLGFLTGGNLDADKAEFFDLDVAFLPAVAPEEGDYNRNGKVDAADYVLWRQDRTPLDNEASGVTPLDTTPEDYDAWRERFGNPNPGGGGELGRGAVPEPATLAMLALAGLCALGRRSRCF
jgi:hypothetical protein